MLILQTHSELTIRHRSLTRNVIEALSGFRLHIPVMDVNAPKYGDDNDAAWLGCSISAGVYTLCNPDGFVKRRGSICAGNQIYQFELLLLVTPGQIPNLQPLIIRLWNSWSYIGSEYLMSENISAVRCGYIKGEVPTQSVFKQIMSFVMGHIEGQLTDSLRWLAGNSQPMLIPNLSEAEYIEKLQEYGWGPDLISSMNNLLELFFGRIDADDLIQLLGIISGKIPHRSTAIFKHPGTYTHDSDIVNSTVVGMRKYDAIRALSRLIFDHFVFSITLDGWVVSIDELDSMAGPNIRLSDANLVAEIELVCRNFIIGYFQQSTNGQWLDVMDDRVYPISSVTITRTMDEYVSVTVCSGGSIYEQRYDLITLAILSPVIGN